MTGAILPEHRVLPEDVRVDRDDVQLALHGGQAVHGLRHVGLYAYAVVDLQGGGALFRQLSLLRLDPRPPRGPDRLAHHLKGHAHADHGRLEGALLLQVAIGNRVHILFVAAHGPRVDHRGVALQAVADAAGDHLGHGHILVTRVHGCERHAAGQFVQDGRLELADRPLGLLDYLRQTGVHGVVGDGLKLDSDSRLGRGVQGAPLEVHDRRMGRVHAGLDDPGASLPVHLEGLLVVVAS
mmetsp:Transcript_22440/g.67175  ORF Transcript_22440/g.67175 Transcript_22440/m.67175 type:complete len:239 (-) Transcript_22440:963-1679(-)